MEGRGGGSSTPSYSHAISSCFKKPLEVETGSINREKHKNYQFTVTGREYGASQRREKYRRR